MRLRFSKLLAAALIAIFCGPLLSASRPRLLPSPPEPVVIAIGNSTVPLNGPWKFSPGDSPWSDVSPLWAQPAFDDSNWTAVNLTPPPASIDPIKGSSGFVPGWTSRGHAKLTGFAWYRLAVRLTDPTQRLWIKMPGNFNDAYEIYANGQFIGRFGQIGIESATTYYPQPASFALPQPGPDGQLEIALRFYMSPSTPSHVPSAGGPHQPPVIGLAAAIQLLQHSEKDANLRAYSGELFAAFLFLLVLPLAIWALLTNPREYAWYALAGALLLQVLLSGLHVGAELTSTISTGLSVSADSAFKPIVLVCWVIFWWSWLGCTRLRLIPIASALLALAHNVASFASSSTVSALDSNNTFGLQFFGVTATIFLIAQSGLLIFLLWQAVRRHSDEDMLAAPPILLFVLSNFTRPLFVALDIPLYAYPFGFGFSAIDFEQIFMIVIVGALVAHRFQHDSVSREVGKQTRDLDLVPARQLQQLILVPEDLHSQHFSVEAEYRVGKVVGGDFYLTVLGLDGSMCIVIGDVSGNGISAAMLVSMLVGAARSRASQDFNPANMLQTLDERLNGRSGGLFATCLAAQLFPNGVLRVANAGHLPPYLNGSELDLEGSFPLGIAGKLNPTIKQFQIHQGDILTFMTDGVVEATNATGEMIGFEYARELSKKPAAEVISEVQEFGQQDDITILRLSFLRAESIGPIISTTDANESVLA
jgi:serine phosphatase RsbU (regulator of sigma subunit)